MANQTDETTVPAPATPLPEPRKSSAFQISQEPVTAGETETEVENHKFEVAPEPVREAKAEAPAFEDLGTLPASYHEDTLFLVARDPRWLFCYWDFDWSKYLAADMRHGYAQFFLKIARVEAGQESLVEINPVARNWYAPVNHPDTAYVAEIGYFDQAGAWRGVVRSDAAHTPPDALAPEAAAVDFATVPAHLTFERMLELVQERMVDGETLLAALSRITGEGRVEFRGGQPPAWTDDQKRVLAALLGSRLVDTVGLGSEEIDQLLRKSLQERLSSESASGLSGQALVGVGLEAPSLFSAVGASLFSAIGASWSAQPFSVHAERGFYMHVNAEIIFYGGTHPDATVTVSGQRIQLSPDGSFRYHFTLADGNYAIPIVALSPDGLEQRSATLSFQRGTERVGEVGATGQPAELGSLIGRR